MKLANASMIAQIDKYLEQNLGISTLTLMGRAGAAVARAVRQRVPSGSDVVILAGKGNNGGDGYAAAAELMKDYSVTVIDIFSAGQRTECGKHFLVKYISSGGTVENLILSNEQKKKIKHSSCIVDAVFGTGFSGEVPDSVQELAHTVRETVGAVKLAVDVPLGVNADDGSVFDYAPKMNATVELSYIKPGIVSFPAKSYVGEVIFDDLGIPSDKIEEAFQFSYYLTDRAWAKANMPRRPDNSNKGTFGKLLLITGSEKYRGAAHLSLSAALRGGVGLVTYLGTTELVRDLSRIFPEAIYKSKANNDTMTAEEIEDILSLAFHHTATLIGSGSDSTAGLACLVKALLAKEGGPLILDADAINALADNAEEGRALIKAAKRTVIMTPHPLEFSRISGIDVTAVQANRISVAREFAGKVGAVLVLKGAATVVTDGITTYINSSGSSALAKAGSGDVLAGLVGSLTAYAENPLTAAALAVYLHGAAGDSCAEIYSCYGVTPSDLPAKIAEALRELEKN